MKKTASGCYSREEMRFSGVLAIGSDQYANQLEAKLILGIYSFYYYIFLLLFFFNREKTHFK
jgi:hypothetical protein